MMIKTIQHLIITSLLMASAMIEAQAQTDVAKGKAIAFERSRGNCLACHYVQGGTLMGNNGPALVAMKARFPKRKLLVQQVADARIKNPNTIMPPFGAHEILTEQEIELVVTWLYSL
jgi:sulfur-oxidizing protein SoxX